MANKFGADGVAHSVGALLAAPITALQEAQIEAEKHVLEFILQYGLKESERPEAPPELALFTFKMRHALPDPGNPGSVVVKPAEVAVPLLSLMHLPAMRISDVKIDLAVEIDETASEEQSAQGGDAARLAVGGAAPMGKAISGPAKVAERLDALRSARNVKPLVGRLSSRSSRSARRTAKMNVGLTIKSVDDDEIYQRLMRLIGDSMTALVSPNEDGGATPDPGPPPAPTPTPSPAPTPPPDKTQPLPKDPPQDPPPTFPEPPVEVLEPVEVSEL